MVTKVEEIKNEYKKEIEKLNADRWTKIEKEKVAYDCPRGRKGKQMIDRTKGKTKVVKIKLTSDKMKDCTQTDIKTPLDKYSLVDIPGADRLEELAKKYLSKSIK